MAFSHETPRHIFKVTLHSPLSPWQYSERETKDVCLPVQTTHWLVFSITFFMRLLQDIVDEICLFFIWPVLYCCLIWGDKYLFLVSWSLFFSPIPQPKQGASSMEDCLNLHGSNVGLQLGLWRVGLSYKPSGQINHLLCAWLPLQYRLSSFSIVWVTFISFSGI